MPEAEPEAVLLVLVLLAVLRDTRDDAVDIPAADDLDECL
jgi:hypothetical protein